MASDVVEAHEQTLRELEGVIDEFRTGSITAAIEQLEAMRTERAEAIQAAATDDDDEDDED